MQPTHSPHQPARLHQSPQLWIDGVAAGTRDLRFGTGGVRRWVFRADGTAESGSDAGSNFQIRQCTDAGALGGFTALFIERSSGRVKIGTSGVGVAEKFLVQNGTATDVVTVIRGASAQSADATQWQTIGGTVLSSVNASGLFRIAATGTLGTAEKLRVNDPTTADNTANTMLSASATTSKPLVIQGIAGQTANLQEWQNSSGTVLAQVSSSGQLLSTNSVNAQGLTGTGGLNISTYGAAGNPAFRFRRSEGSYDVPTATALNSEIGGLKWQGYGTSFQTGASIQAYAAELWSATAWGTQMTFSTTALTTTSTSERMRISASGTLQVADSTAQASLGTIEKFRVFTPTTADNSANAIISTSATTSKGLVIQAKSSQTANLQEWQDSTAAVLRSISATGALSIRVVSLTDATSITP